MGITQAELGAYLGVTRQTVAKVKSGAYFRFGDDARKRLMMLDNRSKDEVKKILQINQNLDNFKELIFSSDSGYIDAAFEGIDYMSYWLLGEKFADKKIYHKYYYGHMNNFFPRYNQAALFMRDTLNRQRYPLLTLQIDYERNLITDACIKAFKDEYIHSEHDLRDVKFPIDFQVFQELLKDRIKPNPRFLLYKDYLDDDWEYFTANLKNRQIDYEIFDLSRLFNFFDNQQPYYGPLLEDVLEQFGIQCDTLRLLRDCRYRADQVVKLVNMVSLEALVEKKHDKSSMLFDSHGLKRDNNYQKKERRKQKQQALIERK